MGRRASFCCEVSNVQGHRHARMSGRTQYGDPSWRSIVPNGLGTVNFLGHPTLVFLIQPACQRPASQQDNLITSRRKSPFLKKKKKHDRGCKLKEIIAQFFGRFHPQYITVPVTFLPPLFETTDLGPGRIGKRERQSCQLLSFRSSAR